MTDFTSRRTVLGLMTGTVIAAAAAPSLTRAQAEPKGANMIKPWTGPYGGVPPFDQVKIEDFEPAQALAMEEQRLEIKAITSQSGDPTFTSVCEAYEMSGRAYGRFGALYGVWNSNLSSPAFQAVSAVVSPRQAAFSDEIRQNAVLFQKIEQVYDNRAKFGLNPQQDRLLWKQYRGFVRAGAKLDLAGKARIAEINQHLATLFDTFSNNLKHDEAQATLLTRDDLAGLPPTFVSSLAAKAKSLGREGEYAVQNTRSAMEPFLTYSTNRAMREKVWRAYILRGDNNDAWDNKRVAIQILKLRAERALLLGYPTHAHWRLEIAMAKTPVNAMALMEAVWTPAVARVREEVADMQAIADQDAGAITLAPWDYRFYAEKVRKARYDLNDAEITPYLQLDKIQAAMFDVAGRMYGFSFEPIDDVPVFHPDVSTYRVLRHGQPVGLWYYDPYAREGKSSGAWATQYQSQARFGGERIPLVSNNCNFIKAQPGQPILMSWTDATTMFHEFGHALHALASNAWYASQSGTNTARDFVEFPSQLNEHWLRVPEILGKFAIHYQTGKAMPLELQDKINKASKFNQGFATVEYLACALIDMKYHLAGNVDIDVAAFEKSELEKLGMPSEIVMRHRPTQFSHIFGSDGYSAGYYSYLWSDALVADAYEKFAAEGGPFGPVAQTYFDTILSVGDTVPQDEAFRNFMGRDVNRDALMRLRGFAS